MSEHIGAVAGADAEHLVVKANWLPTVRNQVVLPASILRNLPGLAMTAAIDLNKPLDRRVGEVKPILATVRNNGKLKCRRRQALFLADLKEHRLEPRFGGLCQVG
mgnify:CR=1 FL=1